MTPRKNRRRIATVAEPAGWTAWVGGEYNSPMTAATAHRQFAKGEKTYNRILGIARQLFAKHGYHGTSVRDICVAAEVNSGAVTYNFGSKEELYTLVLRGFTNPLVQVLADLDRATLLSPSRRIDEWVRRFCIHAEQRPELIPLLTREMASTGEPAIPIIDLFEHLLPQLSMFIAEGRQAGEIREGDPTQLALSVLALPAFLYLARKTTRASTGQVMAPDIDQIRSAVSSLLRPAA